MLVCVMTVMTLVKINLKKNEIRFNFGKVDHIGRQQISVLKILKIMVITSGGEIRSGISGSLVWGQTLFLVQLF